MDLVSVIIPYYKKREHIKKAISSALNQSYKNIEIILVYDGDNQTDLPYIKQLAASNKCIHLIVNGHKLGAGLSRNIGIARAKGSYVAFLDADDYWLAHKTELQLNLMKAHQLKASHTSYNIINNRAEITGYRKARNFSSINQILKSCDIGLSTVMLKKTVITSDCNFPDLQRGQDFALWLMILKRNIPFGALDEGLAYWLSPTSAFSPLALKKIRCSYTIYKKHLQFNTLKSLYYLCCLIFNKLRKTNNS